MINVIKTVIDDLGINQKIFSQELGLNHSTVSMYVSGKRTPSRSVFKAISDKWGYSLDWLLTGEGEKYSKTSDTTKVVSDPIIEAYNSFSDEDKRVIQSFLLKLYNTLGDKDKVIKKVM